MPLLLPIFAAATAAGYVWYKANAAEIKADAIKGAAIGVGAFLVWHNRAAILKAVTK